MNQWSHHGMEAAGRTWWRKDALALLVCFCHVLGVPGPRAGGKVPSVHDAATCKNMKCTQGVCGYVSSKFAWGNPNRLPPKSKYDSFDFKENLQDFCIDSFGSCSFWGRCIHVKRCVHC
ncbi:hypothetical protein KSP40_PGU004018 [Platanthera guangdongensis]|uniref:Secreted protein n=1 Tax=Platanthera guangdongensis TaxID=2320717 RepID=A0ABR2MIX1_9ASPA